MSEGEVDRAKANLLSDLEADLAEREQVGICVCVCVCVCVYVCMYVCLH